MRKKIYRSQLSHVDLIYGAADLFLATNPLEGVGHRKRSLSKLTTAEKIEIVHSAVVGREHHKDIALRMKVSPSLVTRLSLKARRDPQFIDKINAKDVAKSTQVANVKNATEKLLGEGSLIISSVDVSRRLQMDNLADVKAHRLQKILR